jgi:hypothetical protein
MKIRCAISSEILSDEELDKQLKRYNPIGYVATFYWESNSWWLEPDTYGHPTCSFLVTEKQARKYIHMFTTGDRWSEVDTKKKCVIEGWRYYL